MQIQSEVLPPRVENTAESDIHGLPTCEHWPLFNLNLSSLHPSAMAYTGLTRLAFQDEIEAVSSNSSLKHISAHLNDSWRI
jgi:hypothetical protein